MIEKWSDEGKNFGAILVPEGLLNNLAHYKTLLNELNHAFGDCKSENEVDIKNSKLLQDKTYLWEVLTHFSASVFETLPFFF